MIVGNGLLANAFKCFIENKDVLIFASGVSNSKENNRNNFEKEFNLLKKSIEKHPDAKLVYFSTCSIFDESLNKSNYVLHKLEVEKYIKGNCKKYLIFRLPNVVGFANNNSTFFNYFREKILKREKIYIQKYATRYLIDIDDIAMILPKVINSEDFCNKIINVTFNNKMLVHEIVNLFEIILNTKADIEFIDGGSDYSIDNSVINLFIKTSNIQIDKNYNFKILSKYL